MASTIYKINVLDNKNSVETIYVFLGFNSSEDEISDLNDSEKFIEMLTDEEDYLINEMLVFNKTEIETIKTNKIAVVFLNESIHSDDSIYSIKLKIIQNISNQSFSIEEIYLFCYTEKTLNTGIIHDNLSQSNNILITKERVMNYFENVDGHEELLQSLPDKDEYTYDDLFELKLDDKTVVSKTVVGQKFFIASGEYPFAIDPFTASFVDPFLQKSSNEITTLNSHLLLNVSNMIINNNIYLCLASNALEYNDNIPEDYLIKVYYPFLYKKDINSVDTLGSKKEELITQTYSNITSSLLNNFKNIDMFYDVHSQKTSELDYKKTGIQYIKMVLKPENDIKIPLDIIFKLIHATEINPLIKYNISSRQENVYRLYANKTTKDGEKIPYLQKASIFKLMKNIGKTKSVAVFVDYKMENSCSFICEFEENGDIIMIADFDDIVPITNNFEKINKVFEQASNPILETIHTFFEQNGYKISKFTSLLDENVVIKEIIYKSSLGLTTELNLNDFKGCISSVFTILDNNENEIQMRFKRVKNFNKLDSQESYVIDQNKKGFSIKDIIMGLVENFELEESEAREYVANIINELQVERGVKKRDIEIKVNPGFETKLSLDRIKSELSVTVSNIDNILYLNTIPIYIDTMIRLSTDSSTTNYPNDLIVSLCSKEEVEDVIFKDDIIAVSEKDVENQKSPVINDEDDTIVYEPLLENLENEDGQKLKSVFDIFNDNDDDESSSEPEQSGGIEQDEEEEPEMTEEPTNAEKEVKPTANVTSEMENNDKKEEEIKEEEDPNNVAEGPKKVNNAVKKLNNIDGMSLTHPYIFQKRMEDRAASIFATLKDDKFNSYSRMCPSNVRRQPVIINKTELDKINQSYPGYLKEDEGDIIHYKSNPENKENSEDFYYVCPRYWCLLTDSIISDEDVKAGKCGEIIPRDAKKIEPGHYVYEFSHPSEHIGTEGEYIKHYPGFHKDSTKDNKCIPCCFKNWNTTKQITKRKSCEGDKPNVGEEEGNKEDEIIEPAKPEPVDDQYIKSSEKFPLDTGRWGYLPPSIQKFFHDVGAECKISKSTKMKTSCLLRHGIEYSEKKSFIACIADAIFYAEHNENGDIMAIPEAMKTKRSKNMSMLEIIVNSINIDSFITFQNATLIENFAEEINYSDDQVEELFENVDQKYKSSKLYKKSKKNLLAKGLFLKAINANENFNKFLLDSDELVDYTYLWDIICTPNPLLFKSGINLIILRIPENDGTNNVDFICPSNHYSNTNFDTRKRSLFIIERDNVFEPIYEYKDIETKILVNKTFSEYDRQLSKNLRSLFAKIIKPIIQKNCSPHKSTNTYRFNSPILLESLIKQLNAREYTINKQILNLRGKIVGLLVTDKKGIQGFLPCYPSSVDTKYNYDYDYITNDSIWNSYSQTYTFLNRWFKIKKSNKSIKPNENIKINTCLPTDAYCKVLEDNMIVGFLTNTNQFIQISTPQPNIMNDGLHIINNNNYLISDIKQTSSNNVDKERVDYTNKVRFEYSFFNAFRNTVRILLNEYVNVKKHEEIQQIIRGPYSYHKKLDLVIEKLTSISEKMVEFADDLDFSTFKEITTCVSYQNEDKCNTKNPLCIYKGNNCMLIIPRLNLVTNEDNQMIYFTRLADELIRYNHIKSFVSQKNNYLVFEKIGYNLRKDEIIMLQSLLTQEYFERLIQGNTNKYIINNAYDNVNPKYQEYYNAPLSLNDIIQPEEESKLVLKTQKISTIAWRKCFMTESIEIEYPDSNFGTFQFIIDIVEKSKHVTLSEGQIRDDLASLYLNFSSKYKTQLANILISQGKKSMGDQINAGTLSFKYLIHSESYYLTNMDLWFLLDKYQVPSIFISANNLMETGYNEKIFICYAEEEIKDFVFILCSAVKQETPTIYKVIQYNDKIMIKVDDLHDCVEELGNAFTNKIEIEHFINVFKPELTTVYKPKQKGHRVNPADLSFQVVDSDNKEESPVLSNNPSPNLENAIKENIVEFLPVKKPRKTRKPVQKQKNRTKKEKPKQKLSDSEVEIEDDKSSKPN